MLNETKMRFVFRYWKSVLWVAFVFIVCIMPAGGATRSLLFRIPHIDKVIHLSLFFVLGIVLHSDFNVYSGGVIPQKLTAVGIIIFIVLFGLSLELIQHFFISTRSGQVLDLLANYMGYGLSIIASPKMSLWLQKFNRF